MPASLIRNLIRRLPENSALPILSGPLRGMRWCPRSAVLRAWAGIYEARVADEMRRALRPGGTCFDVGANVGYFTLLASRRVGPAGRVAAFEPGRRNQAFLLRHITLNRLENVRVVESAVGGQNGPRAFDDSDPATGKLDQAGSGSVATTTLDQFVAESGWRPDVIKMDIEGAELEALQGARRLLSESGPTLILSYHGTPIHLACEELLAQHGYTTRRIADPSGNWLGEVVAER